MLFILERVRGRLKVPYDDEKNDGEMTIPHGVFSFSIRLLSRVTHLVAGLW
jgi:hypothetical protein